MEALAILKKLNLQTLFTDKAEVITGKVALVPVEINDAEFIFNLRERHEKSFLKKGAKSISDQEKYLIEYLKRYKNKEEIYYKIINLKTKNVEAVVRITELSMGNKFNWESLISIPNGDPTVVIDVMLAVYSIGFDFLNKTVCGPWNVDRKHLSMQKIHDRIGMAKIDNETSEYYSYKVVKADFVKIIPKFKRLGFGLVSGIRSN